MLHWLLLQSHYTVYTENTNFRVFFGFIVVRSDIHYVLSKDGPCWVGVLEIRHKHMQLGKHCRCKNYLLETTPPLSGHLEQYSLCRFYSSVGDGC